MPTIPTNRSIPAGRQAPLPHLGHYSSIRLPVCQFQGFSANARRAAYSDNVRKAVLLAAVLVVAVAALVARSGSTTSTAAGSVGPTYYRDVAPILDAKCASCHRIGGIAPFALTTAADARAHAAGIASLTKAGNVHIRLQGVGD